MTNRLARDIIAGQRLVSLPHDTDVVNAAKLMRQTNIGALIVTEKGQMRGVFTERDAVQRVIASGLDAATIPLSQVMTAGVISIAPETPLTRALHIMYENNIRHLPVVDRTGAPIGIISMRDAMDGGWLARLPELDDAG